METFSKKFNSAETDPFSMFLYEMVIEMKPRAILEIGVNRKGVSTHTFLEAIDNLSNKDNNYRCRLYSVDILDCSGAISEDNPRRQYWNFIRADSKEYYNKFDRVVDILLIDGGHLYEEVKNDYDNYSPFVRNNGYILIHDTIWCAGVNKFWNSDYIKYPKVELNWGTGMGIINKK